VLRFLLWRLLAVLSILASYVLVGWFVRGGPGRLLRGGAPQSLPRLLRAALQAPVELAHVLGGWAPGRVLLAVPLAAIAILSIARFSARRRRDYARVRIEVYRTDHAHAH